MKKQIISVLCAATALCLALSSCGGSAEGKETTVVSAATTTETPTTKFPVSVLTPRDPAGTYAIEPPLELYATDKIEVHPKYLWLLTYNGSEAFEVISILNLLNALTPEELTDRPERLQTADWIDIAFRHGNTAYVIEVGVFENGTAYFRLIEHDTATDTQWIHDSLYFKNAELAPLIDRIQAQLPVSVLTPRNPNRTYAIDPLLELYDNSEICVSPNYFCRLEYVGEEAVEVIAMLNILNALTVEQVTDPGKSEPDKEADKEWYYDWFIIEFKHNNILYNISAGVRTDGTATFGLLEHDLTTDKQTQRYSFHFQNDEWASLIESVRAQISQ